MTIQDTQIKWQPFSRSDMYEYLTNDGFCYLFVDEDYCLWASPHHAINSTDDRYGFRIKLKNNQ